MDLRDFLGRHPVDGSLFDDIRPGELCLGFAIAIVDKTGALLGLGGGIPPPWILSAAGAETWAFFTALHENAHVPEVITDCLGIVRTLERGLAWATAGARPLARLWRQISDVLEGGQA